MRENFTNWTHPSLQHNKLTEWNWMVAYPSNLQLGENVDIGAFTYINALHGITIGNEVQIGSHCSIYSVSTIDDKTGPVKIKKNSKIGSHCTLMPGITIGANSVIGAHSFVNCNIPPNSLYFGIPATFKSSIK